MSEYEEAFKAQDEYAEVQSLSSDPYPYYFAYLYFEQGALKAAVSRDDFTAWLDYANEEWACSLADTLETPFKEFKLIEYLDGVDWVMPDTIYDGSPHPHAGEVQVDNGMYDWFKTIVTNDVQACKDWLADKKTKHEWEVVFYEGPEVSYEKIQQDIITMLESYADDSDGYGFEEAAVILKRYKEKLNG
ncbi:hypothetical protein SEA_BIRDFEEDER_11 [Microbacterium phage Birdfeeder]|nr:hypothetical protein SEA_BIRDFEEDER_11 [Microbacterium phage Birdfeeder]